MAKWHTLQSDFTGGEVSPRYVARSASGELPRTGVLEALNAMVLPQGDITKRLGTTFFGDLELPADQEARVWSMMNPDNRHVLTVWKDAEVDIFIAVDNEPAINTERDNTPKTTGLSQAVTGSLQVIRNGDFTLGLSGWQNGGKWDDATRSYNVVPIANEAVRQLIIMRRLYPSDTNRRNYIRQENATPVGGSTIASISLSVLKRLSDSVINAGNDVELRVNIGTAEGLGDLYSRTWAGSEMPEATLIELNDNAVFADYEGAIHLEISTVLSGTFPAGDPISTQTYWVDIFNVNMYLNYVSAPFAVVTVAAPYAAADLNDLHFIQSPFNNKELMIFHPDYPPYSLRWDGGTYALEETVFADPPTQWGANNWPSIATAYQGRLILTGCPNNPETVWGSKTFAWLDFTVDDPSNPTPQDAIEFTPTERGVNTWLAGFKGLMFGNREAEFNVLSATQLLQIADVGVSMQSGYGALRNPQKLVRGHSVVLPTGGNTALRMVRFSDENGGFVAPDVLQPAEHLGRRVVRRYFYTRDPHEMMWCVMLDGTVCIMSFDENVPYVAWTQFVVDGRVLDGYSFKNILGRDVVALVVERIIDEERKVYLEIIDDLLEITSWSYIDCSTRILSDGVSTTIFGLEYLEGKEVGVFTDGNFEGVQAVEGGQITLQEPAFVVDVGIPIDMKVTTLPEPSAYPTAAGLTSKKRYSKIGIRGLFTLPPIIQGQRNPDRSPQGTMNISEIAKLFEDMDVVDLDWNQTGSITIEEPLPLRMTIAGIYGRLSANEV